LIILNSLLINANRHNPRFGSAKLGESASIFRKQLSETRKLIEAVVFFGQGNKKSK